MWICVTVHEFIERENWIIAFGQELDCSDVNVFVFWALRFCSLLPLQVDDSWRLKLPACSVRSWSELRLSSGSRARPEILGRSNYCKLHFAHMRERVKALSKKVKQKTKTKPHPLNLCACGN